MIIIYKTVYSSREEADAKTIQAFLGSSGLKAQVKIDEQSSRMHMQNPSTFKLSWNVEVHPDDYEKSVQLLKTNPKE